MKKAVCLKNVDILVVAAGFETRLWSNKDLRDCLCKL